MTDIPKPEERSFEERMARARFRAWHRGTREADYMIGGFFDAYADQWGEEQLAWFEELLEQDDVDIMAWALKTQDVPDAFAGPMIDAMMKLDYVTIAR